MKSPEEPLERVRRLCLALPGATEKLAWGAPTFRVGKTGKMFAAFDDHHRADGRVALLCHAPKGKQEVCVGSEPARFYRPPYVGPSGWIGLVLERFDDEELAFHLREAWTMVAPKTLVRAEEETPREPAPPRRSSAARDPRAGTRARKKG